MNRVLLLFICFIVSYLLVFLLILAHTMFNILVLHMRGITYEQLGEGFEKAIIWQPLYNLVIYTIFGYIFTDSFLYPGTQVFLMTGVVWMILSIFLDITLWVVIKHPWKVNIKQYLTIKILPLYLAVFIAPIIGFIL